MNGCYIPPDEKKSWQKNPVKIPGYGPAKSVRNSLRTHFSTFSSQIPVLNFHFSNPTSQTRSLLNSHFSKIFVSHFSTFQYSLLNSLVPFLKFVSTILLDMIFFSFIFFVNDIYVKTAYFVGVF